MYPLHLSGPGDYRAFFARSLAVFPGRATPVFSRQLQWNVGSPFMALSCFSVMKSLRDLFLAVFMDNLRLITRALWHVSRS
jgi:hypothetical protein